MTPATDDAAAEERRLRDLLRNKKKLGDDKKAGSGCNSTSNSTTNVGSSSRSSGSRSDGDASSSSPNNPRSRGRGGGGGPPHRDRDVPRRGSNEYRGRGDMHHGPPPFRGGPPFGRGGGPPFDRGGGPPFGDRGRGPPGMWERDNMHYPHDFRGGPPFNGGGPPPFRRGGGPPMMMRGRGGPPRPPPPGWRPGGGGRYDDDDDRSSSPRRGRRRKHKKRSKRHKRRSRSYSSDSSGSSSSASSNEETNQDTGAGCDGEKKGASDIKKEAEASTTATSPTGALRKKKSRKIKRSHKRRRRSPSHSDDVSCSSSSSSSNSYSSDDASSESSRSSSGSYSSGSSRSSSGSSRGPRNKKKRSSPKKKVVLGESDTGFSKDQRTVFVSQLVMRATERDIKRYFSKKVGLHVRDVILLKDKRTGNHKGIAYIELATIGDVAAALAVNGMAPDFQRFPLLIKASEAEKNYVAPSSSVLTASMIQKNIAESLPASAMAGLATSTTIQKKKLPPLRNAETGKLIESQSVYVGNLDSSVTQDHLFALFSQLGTLEKVSLQLEPSTGMSRGYAFLSFRDPKESYLAIQCMAHQVLAGRGLKTGWATQTVPTSGSGTNVEICTSTELPEDAALRSQKAMTVLGQLMGTTTVVQTTGTVLAEQALDAAMGGATSTTLMESGVGGSAVPTVAQARASLVAQQQQQAAMMVATATSFVAATAVPPPPPPPTQHVLVHNMFDKDQETEPGWPQEIKEEFIDECSKFGKITKAVVISKEVGGKIYASFETEQGAKECVKNLEGRWFDKRQLRVLYVQESDIPVEG